MARGKLGPVDVGGVLRTSDGVVLTMFSKLAGLRESKALRIFISSSVKAKLAVESDYQNVISWNRLFLKFLEDFSSFLTS